MSTSWKRKLRDRQANQRLLTQHGKSGIRTKAQAVLLLIPAPTTVTTSPDTRHPALDLDWVPWRPALFLVMVTAPAHVQVTLMSVFCMRHLAGIGEKEFGWKRLEGKA